MKNNSKSIWRIKVSVFTVLLVLTLLSTAASASVSVTRTPLGAGTPPATIHLSSGGNSIGYTVVPASTTDPRMVQFKDLSMGDETYIAWEFGDGSHLEGTTITPELKNPVHKFPTTGYYISCMTIKCKGHSEKLWVHNNIVIR
ncbi:PKD domain-containing protein [Methanosarcina lacustris]|uniref:PKD domain-containing protein n=1 Tax=Methanosarcina lacustris TaxID=170861 RepID=UPI00064FB0C6|nr:PKD domain-containing protein [Methanosarcina lacustris]